MPAARGLRYAPRHRPDPSCWCRPRVEEEAAGGGIVYHRMVTLLPDTQPRVFATMLEGVPA